MIQARNIDFSSYDSVFPIINTATSNNNVNDKGWYDQYTYTVPNDGVYIVAFAQRMTGGNNNYDFSVRIACNGQEVQKVQTGGSTWVNWISGTVVAIVKASSGDSIKCQSKGGGANSYSTGSGVVSIVRVR